MWHNCRMTNLLHLRTQVVESSSLMLKQQIHKKRRLKQEKRPQREWLRKRRHRQQRQRSRKLKRRRQRRRTFTAVHPCSHLNWDIEEMIDQFVTFWLSDVLCQVPFSAHKSNAIINNSDLSDCDFSLSVAWSSFSPEFSNFIYFFNLSLEHLKEKSGKNTSNKKGQAGTLPAPSLKRPAAAKDGGGTLKRPAAAKHDELPATDPVAPQKVVKVKEDAWSVNKYLYKRDGVWGIKLNKREVYRVRVWQKSNSEYAHWTTFVFFVSVQLLDRYLTTNHHSFPLGGEASWTCWESGSGRYCRSLDSNEKI